MLIFDPDASGLCNPCQHASQPEAGQHVAQLLGNFGKRYEKLEVLCSGQNAQSAPCPRLTAGEK